MSQMNIMHILGSLGPGGAEMGVIRLIEHFPKRKIRHEVCSIGSNVTMKEQLPHGINCHALGIDGANYTVFTKLYKLFKRTRTDIAHVNNLAPWFDVALASRLAGCKCVETFHGIEDTLTEFPLWRRMLLQIACLLSSSVTTVAEPVADRLVQLVRIKRSAIQVLPNAVDTDFFKPCAPYRLKSELKRSLGLPEKGLLFGCVAALRPVKNHQGLINAFAKATLHKNVDNTYLVLVGDGPLEPELKSLATKLGIQARIKFLGRRSDVQKVMQALDIFVLSSKTEGMSYAILEAMASGLPVIATNVGANAGLIQHGIEGYIVPQGDVNSMAERITQASKDRSVLPNMGLNARRKIVESYSVKEMVSSYERLYAEVLGKN